MYCVHRVLYLAACFHGQRLLVQRPADVSRAQDVEADVGNDFNALALPPPSPPIWHEYCAACGQAESASLSTASALLDAIGIKGVL